METRIYTAQEAGEMLGVTPQGIRKWCARNDVPRAGRTWQITESVLAQMQAYYHAPDAPDETNREEQKQAEKQANETANNYEHGVIELLQEQVKALTEQLESKERQIESLTDSLNKSIEQNASLTASLAETAKTLAASRAFENASKALVANDGKSIDSGHYNPSGGQQKANTFLSRLKWLIKGE